MLAGAYTAGANPKQIQSLSDFAERYGLLFQITDDILDATGNADTLGKTVGKDARDEKVTFVTLYGLDGAVSEAHHAADAALEALETLEAADTTFCGSLWSKRFCGTNRSAAPEPCGAAALLVSRFKLC